MGKTYQSLEACIAKANGSRKRISIKARYDAAAAIFYIKNDDGSETAFSIRFKLGNYLYGAVLRVLFDFTTGTATPLPLSLTYADCIRDPGVSALVKSGVSLCNKATAALDDLTSRVRSALDAGAIPSSLYQEVENAKATLIDAATPMVQANHVRRAKVNLLEGGRRIIYPVKLRGSKGTGTIMARSDPGAEDNVISSQKAEKLGVTVIGTEVLEGFTGGNVEVPLVSLEVILKDGTVVPATAAVSDIVKQQTGKDFLVGAELFLAAKNKGELMI